MRFVFYHEGLCKSRTMVVDGVEECRVNLSHWPGNATPEHLKADTSTEIALKLATDPYADRLFENIEFISNNHFDTDGLLSCWTVMHPYEALRHRRFLIQAAQAGDFGWFPSPEAVQFDLVISAFEDLELSPLKSKFSGINETGKFQLLYDFLLGQLPDLFHDFAERYRGLYEDEFSQLEEANRALRGGAATIRNDQASGISFIEAEQTFPLRALFNFSGQDRLLNFVREGDGWKCDFCYHIITWFETTTLVKRPRVDLTAMADRLNASEGRTDATWRADSLTELYPHLTLMDQSGTSIPSHLSKEGIERQFVRFFADAEREMS
jgi:hypothetical protein